MTVLHCVEAEFVATCPLSAPVPVHVTVRLVGATVVKTSPPEKVALLPTVSVVGTPETAIVLFVEQETPAKFSPPSLTTAPVKLTAVPVDSTTREHEAPVTTICGGTVHVAVPVAVTVVPLKAPVPLHVRTSLCGAAIPVLVYDPVTVEVALGLNSTGGRPVIPERFWLSVQVVLSNVSLPVFVTTPLVGSTRTTPSPMFAAVHVLLVI